MSGTVLIHSLVLCFSLFQLEYRCRSLEMDLTSTSVIDPALSETSTAQRAVAWKGKLRHRIMRRSLRPVNTRELDVSEREKYLLAFLFWKAVDSV